MRKTTYDNLGALLNGIILDCWNDGTEHGRIDISLRRRFVDKEGTKHYVLDAQYSTQVNGGQGACSDPTICADRDEEATSQEYAKSAELMLKQHGMNAKQEGDSVSVYGRMHYTPFMSTNEVTSILNVVPGRAFSEFDVERAYRRLRDGREASGLCITGSGFIGICNKLGLTDDDILARLRADHAQSASETKKVS